MILSRIDKQLTGARWYLTLLLGMAFAVGLGFIDHLTGSEVSFSLFYIAPISMVAWYAGQGAGLAISLFSAVLWGVADLSGGHVYSTLVIPVWNSIMRLGFFSIVTMLLARVHRLLDLEEQMADTDPLTGLANRRSFLERARFELERARRYGHKFTIAYIDLDNFKAVNDTRGHDVGDHLLSVVATTLKSNVRQTDIVARLGGDEYAILLADTGIAASKEAVGKVFAKLTNAMAQNRWPVTFSIGVVTFNRPMADIRDMVKSADDLMYEVKKSGKNRIMHMVSPDGHVEDVPPASLPQ